MSRAARLQCLTELAEALLASPRSRPFRVALDGRCGSGKTRLAEELATLLTERGRPVVRATTDDFHRPRAERHRQGRLSPLGYLDDSRDWSAIRQRLLDPLGPEGDCRFVTAAFDLAADRPAEAPIQLASPETILLVDGTFLMRPELFQGWDLRVYLHVPREVALERGVERDASRMGGEVPAREAHEQRYQAAFDLYLRRCDPLKLADWVLDNTQLEAPQLRR